jgi:isovaleryl-CoA dehydrogenase
MATSTVSSWFSAAVGTALLCLGSITDYPMGRFLRDSRLYAVGAGTQEIRRMLIGREFNQEFGAGI